MAEYLLDTGWACGLIIVSNGYIIGGAPIFKKFVGKPFYKFRKYKVTLLRKDQKECLSQNGD